MRANATLPSPLICPHIYEHPGTGYNSRPTNDKEQVDLAAVTRDGRREQGRKLP